MDSPVMQRILAIENSLKRDINQPPPTKQELATAWEQTGELVELPRSREEDWRTIALLNYLVNNSAP